ncbi:helix-turn-helix domain-containing protein [Cohnella nanjingensis]|uniref:Helix-turn-helix domain-containing protein n=1 Tax=Cohnella nanjingensis TaxID=1387779 RepID=A0A7X0RP58_9BACL|nr:helix-turn-helix domain-containing protein [Cohnella nanjingensis]MBB6669946.1 helix-turn-helix domain-containing protein [Cohnella nanjingensis]
MLRNWYFRLLFSYFPILVLTFFIIISLSFIAVSEISRTETKKADGISTGYTVDSIERAAHEIEMTVSGEAVKNANYAAYMNHSANQEIKFGVVHSLAAIVENNELIESVYMYRESDGAVLTKNGQTDLSSFGDRAFVEQAWNHRDYRGWSPIRAYREYDGAEPVRVVSMYKSAPLPFGNEGLLVINIRLYGLEQMISGMTNHNVSFLQITDATGQTVYPSDNGVDRVRAGKVLTASRSDALNWTFESGLQSGQLFAWVSVISYAWVAVALLTFAAALFYIIWITRRNYKPIQLMISRIQTLQVRSDGAPVKLDDLSRIDRALENLIHQTIDYEKEQQESVLIQRRQLFIDLIVGGWSQETHLRLRKLNLLRESGQYAVISIKLNQDEEFQNAYSSSEQNMMKYALGNVMQELVRNEGLEGWGEWTGPDRIAFILAAPAECAEMKERLRGASSAARSWMAEHLRLSLSFGIGIVVTEWSQLTRSYKASLSALDRQLSIGQAFVTDIEDVPSGRQVEMFKYMQLCADCVQDFRLTNERWRERLDGIFERLGADAPRDEDVHALLRLLLQMLGRELKELSASLHDCFEGENADDWLRRLLAAPSLSEMRIRLLEYLNEIYRTYVAVSETKNYKAMITEMRGYIQENFADPDLSLKHLSDRFQITGKYASYLFKQEYDMKFVDFLVQLRMQHAEQLLADSADTIQNIALQVGYANAITFGRVFKRTIGVTPGDFRKLKIRPSAPL